MAISVVKGEDENVGHIRGKLSQIASVEPDEMAMESELGEGLSFKGLVPLFRIYRTLCSELRGLPFETLPPHKLRRLRTLIDRVHSAYVTVQSFRVSPADHESEKDPVQRRDNLSVETWNTFEKIYNELHPFTGFLRTSDHRLASELADSRAAMEENLQVATQAQHRISLMERQVEETVERLRGMEQLGTVSKFSTLFGTEASSHGLWAKVWLLAAGILASLSIFFVWKFFATTSESTATGSIEIDWQAIGARILLVSFLGYAAVWATRNFSAHRHNSVVNRHRHNALQSFASFVETAKSDATREAVLLQTTNCIYDHQPTGYLGKAGASQAKTLVSEVIERVSSRSSGEV